MSTDLPPRSVASIPEAIDVMRGLAAALPAGDGVGHFNTMYLAVTEAVASRLDAGMFVDPEFMDRLDVNFVNLYLESYGRHVAAAGEPVCASWRTLFDHRHDERVRPLQFALAGMNAHINHDLPLAVTITAGQLGRPLSHAPLRQDFLAVNEVLGEADDTVRLSLQGPIADALDDVCGPLDDALSAWGIARARDAAWRQALRLVELQDDPSAYERFLRILDRAVAFAGRCLLSPVSDGGSAHRLLAPAFTLLDEFADRVANVLWGDEVFDGENDGFLGSLVARIA